MSRRRPGARKSGPWPTRPDRLPPFPPGSRTRTTAGPATWRHRCCRRPPIPAGAWPGCAAPARWRPAAAGPAGCGDGRLHGGGGGGRWTGGGRLRRLGRKRQAHHKLAAAVGPLAEGFHRAAVQLDQMPHQREPQPQAALGAMQRGVALDKGLPNPRQRLGADAQARVAQANHGLPLFHAQGKPNLAPVGRVLGRVVQEVGHHLGQADRVAVHVHRLRRLAEREPMGPRLDQRAADVHGVGQHAGQVDHLAAEARSCRG